MNEVRIFSAPNCKWCSRVKARLDELGIAYTEIDIAANPAAKGALLNCLARLARPATVPQIFVGETLVGGFEDLEKTLAAGLFMPLLQEQQHHAD